MYIQQIQYFSVSINIYIVYCFGYWRESIVLLLAPQGVIESNKCEMRILFTASKMDEYLCMYIYIIYKDNVSKNETRSAAAACDWHIIFKK